MFVHFHLQFLSTKRQIWWNYFYDFYILIISMDYGILLVFVCQLQYSLWACESYWFLDTRKGSIQCYWHDSRQRLVLYNTTTLYMNTDVIEYWPIILTKKLLYIYLLVIAYTISNLVSPSSFNDRVSWTNMFIPNIIYNKYMYIVR